MGSPSQGDASPIPVRRCPLNVMAGLVGSQRVDHFKNKIFVKGFSAMLVPTRKTQDVLLWHLVSNRDDSHISYRDSTVAHDETIRRADLDRLRHVVGWCPKVGFYAGEIPPPNAF